MDYDIPLPYSQHKDIMGPGVYFLFKDFTLVYIGSSKNILQRLGIHAVKKKFDYFDFINTRRYISMEKKLIRKYRPMYNQTGLSGFLRYKTNVDYVYELYPFNKYIETINQSVRDLKKDIFSYYNGRYFKYSCI